VTAAYDALAALAERELALAAAGRLDELAEVQREREELVARLPPVPPPAARAALARAASAQAQATAALQAAVSEAARVLRHLQVGRETVRGYAPRATPLRAIDRSG